MEQNLPSFFADISSREDLHLLWANKNQNKPRNTNLSQQSLKIAKSSLKLEYDLYYFLLKRLNMN